MQEVFKAAQHCPYSLLHTQLLKQWQKPVEKTRDNQFKNKRHLLANCPPGKRRPQIPNKGFLLQTYDVQQYEGYYRNS